MKFNKKKITIFIKKSNLNNKMHSRKINILYLNHILYTYTILKYKNM